MDNLFTMKKEFSRLILETIERELNANDIECRMSVSDNGDYSLYAMVKGPMKREAQFEVRKGADEDPTYRMDAVYVSDVLPEGNLGTWHIPVNDPADEICDGIVIPFLDDCFIKEHENECDTVVINNDNLEDYIPFLDDDALTIDGIYALGIRAKEEDGPVPIGAISFRLSDESLIIENVFVMPEYQGFGIEEYAEMVLKEKILDSLEE